MKKLLLLLLCVPLVGLGQEIKISTQTTNTKDTIRFLEKKVLIDNVNTNREYYQAMLSLIDDEIKNDSTNKSLKEIKYYYNSLIQGIEDFNIEGLSNSSDKIENELQQYLINNPEKVQFHINKGKKFDVGVNLEIYDKEYQERGYFPHPGETDEID